ncbi:MAG: ATP-binding protein [Candidatus Eremiobacterota bacterium]
MTINKDSHNLILSNLIDGIVITDNNKRIISCNNSYLKMIGYNLEEIKGTSYLDLVDSPFKNSEALSLEAPVIKSYESKHIKKNGEKIHFHVRCMAINEVTEGQNGYVYNLQDITAYKDREKEAQEYAEKIKQFTKHLTQAHDQLLEAKIAAEVANKAKSMFLASMSHEIRSPLSSIIGFSEIMYEDDTLPKEEIKDMSNVILKSGRNLLELLNEILDLSKIEAGKIVIERREFDLEDVILHIINLLQIKANEKHISLELEYDPKLPESIVTDETRLRQIFMNLMSNAIKFTSQGYVKLRCKLSEDANFAEFSVIDTGIGISADKIKTIFEPFSQAEASTTRKYGGTGLGLTITEKLVTLLGGKIWVESEVGKGTVFNFTLPLTSLPVEETQEKEDSIDSLIKSAPVKTVKLRKDRKILIADDDSEFRLILSKPLTDAGYTVMSASNGKEALNLFKQEELDFILMDINMPEMDGIEVTKEIRLQSGGSSIPIIACTGSAMGEELEKFVEAGFDDYIIKPVDRNELLDIIAKFIG